jgi:hypothetical protein
VKVLRRLIASVAILARDPRIPRPLRGAAALGLLPLPGPFDEAILLIVAVPLLAFYRQPMREAWRQAGSRCADESV